MKRWNQKGGDGVTQIQISGQEPNRFSGQDSNPNDFPVENRNRFSGLDKFWDATAGVLAVAWMVALFIFVFTYTTLVLVWYALLWSNNPLVAAMFTAFLVSVWAVGKYISKNTTKEKK